MKSLFFLLINILSVFFSDKSSCPKDSKLKNHRTTDNTNMLRSKSRSGSIDFGQKNHYSSVFSRTLSASKFCRGDALGSQINSNALKSVDKKPLKISNSSESRIDRVMSMQQQMGELEEELKRTKEKLSVTEIEKDRAFDQLKGAKEEVHEANMRANEALSPKKARELKMELENLKDAISCLRDELILKDKKIEYLELKLGKVRQYEVDLAEKDGYLDRLKEELRSVKDEEKDMMVLLSESKRRIQELEAEVGMEKQSGLKIVDSLAIQARQLEATKIELEESKMEITSLNGKIESLGESSNQISGDVKGFGSKGNGDSSEENIKGLMFELQMAKESEKKVSLKGKSLLEEMELLKNELKLAVEGEEKSTKAMEDLAIALKEVATESNQAKEKLNITQIELEHVKGEAEKLKEIIRSNDERHQKLLDEAKQEADLYRNTADRLRLEAEETLLAWNGKEMGFVSCIKRAEEERAIAQHESNKLAESLKAAEHMTRAAREETYKLRDILKQAINEANAAKAAAGLARDENSQLKDCLSEKEEALHFLTRENERLRINEAAARENAKEFKRLLSITSTDLKVEDVKDQNEILSSPDSIEEENKKKDTRKTFSFDLEDLKFMRESDHANDTVLDEDPEKAEALKGSIFDANAETPTSEPHTPKPFSSHQRGYSSAFTDDGGTPHSDDFDHLDGTHDDSDADKGLNRRRKTMFRRVGDLLMIRKSFNKKDPSIE